MTCVLLQNRYQIFLQSPDGPVDIYVVSMNADEAPEGLDQHVEPEEEQVGEEEAVSVHACICLTSHQIPELTSFRIAIPVTLCVQEEGV